MQRGCLESRGAAEQRSGSGEERVGSAERAAPRRCPHERVRELGETGIVLARYLRKLTRSCAL
jgi:hypothetical protein